MPGTKLKPLPYLSHARDIFLGRTVNHILGRQRRPAHLRRCYENPMAEALKAMALEGHGVAWLTETSVKQEFKRRRLTRAGDSSWDGVMDVRIYRCADISRDCVEDLWSLLE